MTACAFLAPCVRAFVLLGCTLPIFVATVSRCDVGVIVNGMGHLDGDYMHRGWLGGEDYYGYFEKSREGWNYLVRYDNASENTYLSKADAEKVEGKWIIIDGGRPDCDRWGGPNGTDGCKVLAVCKAGCPDVSPLPGTKTSTWPVETEFDMQWELLGEKTTSVSGASVSTSAAQASCCTRQPQRCDACDNLKTCGVVSVDQCPAGALDSLARECCGVFSVPQCTCKGVPRVCHHPSRGDVVV